MGRTALPTLSMTPEFEERLDFCSDLGHLSGSGVSFALGLSGSPIQTFDLVGLRCAGCTTASELDFKGVALDLVGDRHADQ